MTLAMSPTISSTYGTKEFESANKSLQDAKQKLEETMCAWEELNSITKTPI